MSAGPAGVGSAVIYHQATGVDVPATVWCTQDSWTTEWSSAFGSRVQPGAGEAYLYTFDGDTPLTTEGTGAGQYSLISLAMNLGTIDLGSIDLSTAVAASVVVPDA